MGIPRNHDRTPLPKDDTGAAGRKCCAPKADAKQARQILILGLAYKPNVSDIRESPSIDIMKILDQENIKFTYNDPMVRSVEIEGQIYKSQNIESELLKNTDLTIISTDHSIYDWEYITDNSNYIFDTRNALRNIKKSKAIIFKL